MKRCGPTEGLPRPAVKPAAAILEHHPQAGMGARFMAKCCSLSIPDAVLVA